MGDETSLALIDSLLDPAVYGAGTTEVRLVETHISWVLLTGEIAFKIKKPLKLPFLDFTTLDHRHRYCQEEIRLNRRLAPELYLDVTPIGGTVERPRLGVLPAIEYAVRMREFPAEARLDARLAAGRVRDADIVTFAELIGGFHAGLPPAPLDSPFGTATSVLAIVEKNLLETAAECPRELPKRGSIERYLCARGEGLRPVLERRRRAGAIREGHGDLHLENLVAWRSRILPFDALEFDPALRWIDVVDEAAFVTMDLMAHGRADLAYRFLNRYMEVTGDYDGLSIAPYYMVHRALVRAKVRAIRAHQPHHGQAGGPEPYLGLARRLVAPAVPLLLITHGFSGSGKTTWTEPLIPRLPALRLRSDLMRKRLAGLGEHGSSHSPVGGGLYSTALNDATYSALARAAAAGLRAGFDIIVDAAFLDRERRRQFAQLAERHRSRFLILDFRAAAEALRERIETRRTRARDASEATLAVLDHQLARHDALSSEELSHTVTIDTDGPVALDRLLASIGAAGC